MHKLFAAVAALALLGAGSAMAGTVTAATANSSVTGNGTTFQFGAGTTLSQSQEKDTTVSEADALSLQPVFSINHANSVTTGTEADETLSTDPFEASSSNGHDAGAGTSFSLSF